MPLRRLSIVAVTVTTWLIGGAWAATDNVSRAPASVASVATSPVDLAAYRAYTKAQADLLVGMIKVLATEVRDGNLEAAQSAYAPAHRYLARLEPVVKLMADLDSDMDARSDILGKREVEPAITGFHRIEYGLFARRSTDGLVGVADRLFADARRLRERLAALDLDARVLIEQAALVADDLAARGLDGSMERYARSDLWDIEAGVDGIREIVAAADVGHELRDIARQTRLSRQFAALDTLLAAHKEGCGFKNYDALGRDEKMAFKRPLAALAAELAAFRGLPAMD